MNRFSIIAAMTVISLMTMSASAQPPKDQPEVATIPLDQVWALNMPGTKPMSVLRRGGAYVAPEGELLEAIRRSLTGEPVRRSSKRNVGFAVLGTGEEALQRAHDILVGKVQPQNILPSGKEASIVFYSRPSEHKIVLEQVKKYVDSSRIKRPGKTVEIQYRIIPSESTKPMESLSLIPIGKVPQGMIHVSIIQLNDGEQQGTKLSESAGQIASGSFSFSGFRNPNAATATNLSDHEWPVEPTEIPLADIFAWSVPDTKPIKDSPLMDDIRRALTIRPVKTKERQSGFAVTGSGMDALRQAYKILVEGDAPHQVFSADNDITIVFFSNTGGNYVHLNEVRRSDGEIEIRYRFVPHSTAEVTEHIALIPLGKLQPGDYRVRMTQLPIDEKLRKFGFRDPPSDVVERIICRPFSLEVSQSGH